MLENVSEQDSQIGITIGFSAGLIVVFGLEIIISAYFEDDDEFDEVGKRAPSIRSRTSESSKSTSVSASALNAKTNRESLLSANDEDVNEASLAMMVPEHRHRVDAAVGALCSAIKNLQDISKPLTEATSDLSLDQSEQVAEKFDEEIHRIEYLIDRGRR